MPYYNFRRGDQLDALSEQCANDAHALAVFGAIIDDELSFEGEAPAPYLLGRREEPLGWAKTNIPVYGKRRRA